MTDAKPKYLDIDIPLQYPKCKKFLLRRGFRLNQLPI